VHHPLVPLSELIFHSPDPLSVPSSGLVLLHACAQMAAAPAYLPYSREYKKRTYSKKGASAYKRRRTMGVTREEVKLMVARGIDRAEETKFGYANGGPTAITTGAPTLGLIFGNMLQGVANTARLGQQITVKSMELRLAADCNAAACSRIRVMLIRDKQTNGRDAYLTL